MRREVVNGIRSGYSSSKSNVLADPLRGCTVAYPAYSRHVARKPRDADATGIKIDVIACCVFLSLLAVPVSALPDTVSIVVRGSRFLAFVWAAIIFLTRRYYRETNLLPVWLLLCSCIVATFANWNGFMAMAGFVCPIFASVVLTRYLLQLKGLKGMVWISVLLSVLLIVQGISALTGGFGIGFSNNIAYVKYFFGMRVEISNIYIFAVALSLIVAVLRGTAFKVLALAAIASGLYFILYEWVSTAITATLVFSITLALDSIIKREKTWRFLTVLALTMAILYMLYLRTADAFEWFIVDFLGKNTTFSGRTFIWDQMFSYMNGWHWLFGNGLNSGMLFYLGANNEWSANTAHSQYLNLIFYFGFAGLISYVFMLVKQFSVTKRLSNPRIRALVIAANIAIIVTGIPTTTFRRVYLYIYYVIITTLPAIVEESNSVDASGQGEFSR